MNRALLQRTSVWRPARSHTTVETVTKTASAAPLVTAPSSSSGRHSTTYKCVETGMESSMILSRLRSMDPFLGAAELRDIGDRHVVRNDGAIEQHLVPPHEQDGGLPHKVPRDPIVLHLPGIGVPHLDIGSSFRSAVPGVGGYATPSNRRHVWGRAVRACRVVMWRGLLCRGTPRGCGKRCRSPRCHSTAAHRAQELLHV
jgi:hypothetical protein